MWPALAIIGVIIAGLSLLSMIETVGNESAFRESDSGVMLGLVLLLIGFIGGIWTGGNS